MLRQRIFRERGAPKFQGQPAIDLQALTAAPGRKRRGGGKGRHRRPAGRLVGCLAAVLLALGAPSAKADPVAVVQDIQQGTQGENGHLIYYQHYAQGTDGGAGGDAAVSVLDVTDPITAIGLIGIYGESLGGNGGHGGGGVSTHYTIGGNGGQGGNGNQVTIENSNEVITTGDKAIGIYGSSRGGDGGKGGDAYGIGGKGGDGAGGGRGDLVQVITYAGSSISTSGKAAHGIFVQSLGGHGGAGGDGGGIWGGGGCGSSAGGSGPVEVHSSGFIQTLGDEAHGILAQSIGGFAGQGGIGAGLVGYGGDSHSGGDANRVYVDNGAEILTSGSGADALRAQSIGGGGGSAGSGYGLVALGGDGSAGGYGGDVLVNNSGYLQATGAGSHGIFAQSLGGGGGKASSTIGLVAIGGSSSSTSHGGEVDVLNSGAIYAGANAILAQSIGGGGGDGSLAVGVVAIGGRGGGGGDGGQVSVTNSGALVTLEKNAAAIMAQSLGGGGGRGGGALSADFWGSVSLGGKGAKGGSGGQVSVTNNPGGSIETVGDSSPGLLAQSIGGGGGQGGFSVAGDISKYLSTSLAIGGGGGGGGSGGQVEVQNSANISTQGAHADGILAQSQGGGGGSGGFSVAASLSKGFDLSMAVGGSGGSGGGGGAVSVKSDAGAMIRTEGKNAVGIAAQSIGGGGGAGGFDATVDVGLLSAAITLGGSGGNGGSGGEVSVENGSAVTTSGHNSHAIFAQSLGGGGGRGGFSASGSIDLGSASLSLGGTGGNGGASSKVTVTSTGNLSTTGDNAIGVLAQSIGGGGGSGGFSASGAITLGAATLNLGGLAGFGYDADQVILNLSGDINTAGHNAAGVLAQSVGGGGGHGGFSAAGALSLGSAALSLGGAGGDGGSGQSVTVTSAGAISTGLADNHIDFRAGNDSPGIMAQSLGGGGGHSGMSIGGTFNGGSGNPGSSLALSLGGNGSSKQASSVNVTSTGASIKTLGDRSPGIVAQSLGGGGGSGGVNVEADNAGTTVISGELGLNIGGNGGLYGHANSVTVVNESSIATGWRSLLVWNHGHDSPGILAQSIGGGGGSGGFSLGGSATLTEAMTSRIGGRGGVSGQGGAVNVNHRGGQITTQGDRSAGIAAQSIGGGGGSGGFSIAGTLFHKSKTWTLGGTEGSSGDGGQVKIESACNSVLQTHGDDSPGILAQSIGGGGGSGGFSVNLLSNLESLAINVGGDGGGGKGGAVTLTDYGEQIDTKGRRGPGILAQSIGGGGGSGGGGSRDGAAQSISIAIGGRNNVSGSGQIVAIETYSSITTRDDDSPAILAQSIGAGGGFAGANVGDNPGQGANVAVGGQSGSKGDGGQVTIDAKAEKLNTSGKSASGIVAQSIGGGGGIGWVTAADTSGAAGSVTLGGNNASGKGGAVSVTNRSDISVSGAGAHGIVAQSIGGGGGLGSTVMKDAVSHIGGSNNASGDAGEVTLTNTGAINLHDSNAVCGLVAQSIGGGGGLVSHTSSEAPSPFSGGLTPWHNTTQGSGKDVTVTSSGDITAKGLADIGIVAQSLGGGGGLNMSQGQGGSSGGSGDSGKVTVTQAGTMKLTGAGSLGILAQSKTGSGTAGSVTVNVNGKVEVRGDGARGILASTKGQSGQGPVNLTVGENASLSVGPVLGTDPNSVALTINSISNDITITNHGTITSAGKLLSTLADGPRQQGLFTFTNYGTLSSHGDLEIEAGCLFRQADGKHTLDGKLVIANTQCPAVSTRFGDYRLQKGELETKGIELGYEIGSFYQGSGTNTVNGNLSIYSYYNPQIGGYCSTYNLDDGHLHVENLYIANKFDGAWGMFRQNGGRNRVTEDLIIGLTSNCNGYYYLNGGHLQARHIKVLDGGHFVKQKSAELVCEDLLIQPRAEFIGSGTVVGHIVSSGLIRAGNPVGTLTIVGSLIKNAGGRLHWEAASSSDYDRVQIIGVPGTLTLNQAATANGGGVILEPELLKNGFRPRNNQVFANIVTSTGVINGRFSQVINNHLTMSWQVIYHPYSIDLMLQRDYANPILGLNANQAAVAHMLNRLDYVTSGDLAGVLNEIDYLTDAASVRQAYKQISPEKAWAMGNLALTGAVFQMRQQAQRVTDLRFGQLASGLGGNLGALRLSYSRLEGLMLAYNSSSLAGLLSSETTSEPARRSSSSWGLYLYPSLLLGSQKSSANQTGYNYTAVGFTAGADFRLRDNLVVGLASGYSHTGAGFYGSTGNVQTDTWPLTVYAAYLGSSWYAYGSLGYALNLFDMERKIAFGQLQRTAKSSTTGHQLNAYAEAGYDVKAKKLIVTPMVSLAYSGLWVNGYKENGAGALNLKVGPQSADSLQTGVGAKVAVPIKRGRVAVVPQAYVSYQHEFANSRRGLNAALNQGGTFTWRTDAPRRDFALVGGRVDIMAGKNLQIGLSYNAEVGRSNSSAHSVYGGLRWNF